MTAERMVLCLVLRDYSANPQILLGIKKYGFGQGKLVAPGGHPLEGEPLSSTAARELEEETGLIADNDDFTHVAALSFSFPSRSWSAQVDVVMTTSFTGDLRASDELDASWFPTADLPLGRMWDDDSLWLPQVLAGQSIRGSFVYDAQGERVADYTLEPW